MAIGRLEAQITVPTGGWDLAATHSTEGAQTITLAADTYHMTDATSAITALSQAFNLAYTAVFTVSLSSAGIVTISVDTGTVAIAWTDTELRDLLGFTGNLSTAASHVAPNQVQSVWYPECPARPPFGLNDDGWYEYDAVTTESPGDGSGVVSTAYNQKVASSLIWSHVESEHAVPRSTAVNESFMEFYDDGVFGAAPWGTAGGPIRWYPDVDSSSYTTYRIPVAQRVRPEQVTAGSDTFYQIEIPRMVKV